jgi:hypothetical protein
MFQTEAVNFQFVLRVLCLRKFTGQRTRNLSREDSVCSSDRCKTNRDCHRFERKKLRAASSSKTEPRAQWNNWESRSKLVQEARSAANSSYAGFDDSAVVVVAAGKRRSPPAASKPAQADSRTLRGRKRRKEGQAQAARKGNSGKRDS